MKETVLSISESASFFGYGSNPRIKAQCDEQRPLGHYLGALAMPYMYLKVHMHEIFIVCF